MFTSASAAMTGLPECFDEQPKLTSQEPDGEVVAALPWGKILVLALVVLALLGIVYLSPLRDYLSRVREVSDSIKRLGLFGPLVLTGSVAVLVAIGFPRLLLCVISGMALGFWSGLFWAQFGTLLGNYAVFLLVRLHGRGWAERYLSTHGGLAGLVRRKGIIGVILARQVPVPGLLINLACGLLPLRHRDFLIATAIGQLPEGIPCTMIGAGIIAASFGKSAGTIGLALVLAVLMGTWLQWFLRRRTSQDPSISPG
jgi:uncharacterized membrane protein YdjX (TVP38/TMEM64 family)